MNREYPMYAALELGVSKTALVTLFDRIENGYYDLWFEDTYYIVTPVTIARISKLERSWHVECGMPFEGY